MHQSSGEIQGVLLCWSGLLSVHLRALQSPLQLFIVGNQPADSSQNKGCLLCHGFPENHLSERPLRHFNRRGKVWVPYSRSGECNGPAFQQSKTKLSIV